MPQKREKLAALLPRKKRKEAAKQLKITVQWLNAIIRGDSNPSLELAKNISDYLGLTIDEVFYGENGNVTFQKEGDGVVTAVSTGGNETDGNTRD